MLKPLQHQSFQRPPRPSVLRAGTGTADEEGKRLKPNQRGTEPKHHHVRVLPMGMTCFLNIRTAVFTPLLVLSVKNQRWKLKKTRFLSAAILCPAVCISDVITRRACVEEVANTSRANSFLFLILLIGKVQTNMAAPWELKFEAKICFFRMNTDRRTQSKHADYFTRFKAIRPPPIVLR